MYTDTGEGASREPGTPLVHYNTKKREKLRDQAGPNGAWLGKGGFVRWGNRVAKQRRERDSEHKIRSQESANTKERLKKKQMDEAVR
jgi:hypothetical protein